MTKEILFSICNFPIPSYEFFVLLGLAAACIIFYLGFKRKKIKITKDQMLTIFFTGLIGGVLGAKIPVWTMHFNEIILLKGKELLIAILSGRTVVGGLIGGIIGVEIAKKKLKIKQKTGDIFAPAIAIGIAIGRIGCFLKGCCFGKETSSPISVYSHDALRHPTQLYEAGFHFLAFILMICFMKKFEKAIEKKKSFFREGDIFTLYIMSYAIFRFFMEFLRADEIMMGFISAAQCICLLAIFIIFAVFIKRFIIFRRLNKK